MSDYLLFWRNTIVYMCAEHDPRNTVISLEYYLRLRKGVMTILGFIITIY